MIDPLTSVLLERIADGDRATAVRVGTVSAIDATALALSVDVGGVITGVRWVSTYAPTVGDVVVLVVSPVGWIVLGKLSKQLTGGGTSYGTATAVPSATWWGRFAMDDWYWAVATDGQAAQGVHEPYGVVERNAAVWYFPSLTAAIPSGATITTAKLRLTRWAAPEEGPGITPEAALVTPRLRLHAYTTMPSGAPVLLASPAPQPWSPGSLAPGQPGVWDLPSAWLTALLAGAARGIAADSPAYADYTRFSTVQVEIAYSLPA